MIVREFLSVIPGKSLSLPSNDRKNFKISNISNGYFSVAEASMCQRSLLKI